MHSHKHTHIEEKSRWLSLILAKQWKPRSVVGVVAVVAGRAAGNGKGKASQTNEARPTHQSPKTQAAWSLSSSHFQIRREGRYKQSASPTFAHRTGIGVRALSPNALHCVKQGGFDGQRRVPWATQPS